MPSQESEPKLVPFELSPAWAQKRQLSSWTVRWLFQTNVALCSLGCLGTHTVDQTGLGLGDLPASTS